MLNLHLTDLVARLAGEVQGLLIFASPELRARAVLLCPDVYMGGRNSNFGLQTRVTITLVTSSAPEMHSFLRMVLHFFLELISNNFFSEFDAVTNCIALKNYFTVVEVSRNKTLLASLRLTPVSSGTSIFL